MHTEEFMIDDDGIGLHSRLDLPGEKTDIVTLVLLFPGFAGDMEEPQIIAAKEAILEAGCGVLCTELYGHGKSGGTFKDHTLLKWLSNAVTVTDYAGRLPFVKDLHLCGHSQGGLLAVLLAAVKKDVFRSMILLSPAVNIPCDAKRGTILGQSFDPDHVPELLGVWYDMELSGNYARTAQLIDAEAAASAYHGPVLIIHGEQDELVPYAWSKRLLKYYRNAQLCGIPGALHCYEDRLDEMKEPVTRFLNEMKTAETSASLCN